jgi:hypothetical protein
MDWTLTALFVLAAVFVGAFVHAIERIARSLERIVAILDTKNSK